MCITPAMLATQLARLATAKAVAPAYTTQSAEYAFVSPALVALNTELDADDTADDEVGEPWLLGPGDIGWDSWVPPLKRFTQIDPVDATEALDMITDYVGMHVIA